MWKTILSVISTAMGGDGHHHIDSDYYHSHEGSHWNLDPDVSNSDHHNDHQRSGFQSGFNGYTPSSTSDIQVNTEVTFHNSSGTHEGTVLSKYISDDSYKVQTTDGDMVKVYYSQITKYRSK